MHNRLSYLVSLLPKANSPNFTPPISKLEKQISNLESGVFFIISDRQASKKETKQDISYCLRCLTLLMNRLYFALDNREGPDKENSQKALDSLKRFIFFIKKHASSFFDYQIYTPDLMLDELRADIRKASPNLETKLNEFGIRKDLVKIVIEPLNKVVSRSKSISFRRFFYIKSYIDWLREFVYSTIHFDEYECELIRLLITKNFNSSHFQRFLTKYIEEKLNWENSTLENLTILMKLKICIADIVPANDLSYTSKNKSTAKVFQKSISERIECYEQMMKASDTVKEPTAEYCAPPNIKTTFKVAHLGILCRLLIDEGLIVDAGSSDLTNAIASIFTLENSESISKGNLRNKFYSHDKKSLHEFRKLLNAWLERINQYTYELNYK